MLACCSFSARLLEKSAASGSVVVTPIDDALSEGAESVSVAIASASYFNAVATNVSLTLGANEAASPGVVGASRGRRVGAVRSDGGWGSDASGGDRDFERFDKLATADSHDQCEWDEPVV